MLLLVSLGPASGQPAQPARSGPAAQESVYFQDLPVVEAASLHTQTLQDAPANVSVISRDEIRRYGYRTLAEVLSNTRGFHMSFDGGSYYAGIRGFSLPGDYNTRILVMINGHQLTDNVYSAMYMFGQDFGLDMDLVDRIEVIRGPSSALYGSNGVFATINIITVSPVDLPKASGSIEAGSFGEAKVSATAAAYLGDGVNLLVSGSAFRSAGRTVYSPELGLSADRVSADQGYHTFLNLAWRDWSVMAYFNDREVALPFGMYEAIFNGRGTKARDGRSFVEAAYTRATGATGNLRLRLFYDQFRYWGRYDYMEEGSEAVWDNRDSASGDWVGTELSYTAGLGRAGLITVGGEAKADLRQVQESRYIAPMIQPFVFASDRNHTQALFAQHELTLGRRWALHSGLRLDNAEHFSPVLSPRVGLIFNPDRKTAYKFLYGRAFRNPSAYEMFYGSTYGDYIANPDLRPERADTFEAVLERKLRRSMDLIVTGYHYRVSNLIEAVETEQGAIQYRNLSAARATGMEAEIHAHPTRGLETTLSAAVQSARKGPARLANSPETILQLRAAAPVAANRLLLAGAARYISSRLDATRAPVRQVLVADTTVTTQRLHRGFDLQFGVRNLLGRRYSDPLSPEHITSRFPMPGRTFFIKLGWQSGR